MATAIHRIHDKAKSLAMQDLIANHPMVWQILRQGTAAEIREQSPELTCYQVSDKARRQAFRELKDDFPGEWSPLLHDAVQRVKAQL